MRSWALIAVIAATSAGCKRAPAARSPEEARALGLADPGGKSPVDTLIKRSEERLEKAPSADSWVILGNAWVKKARASGDPGFYLNADACADQALALAPETSLALNLRALVLLNDHKFEEATALSRKILVAHPDDAVALGNMSDALLELGHFEDAARAAQQMVDLKPNLPSYTRASWMHWLQGDSAGAKVIIRHAIDSGWDQRDVEPLAWTFVQAAMLFWHEGDLNGADEGFDRALGVFEDYPPALVGKGRVALAVGRNDRALDFFRRAYAISPLIETQGLLADAQEASGDKDGAEKERESLVRRAGQDRLGVATWLVAHERSPEQALKLIEAELAARGGIYVDDTHAWALYRLKRFDDARAAIDHALHWGTRDARLLFHAGAIHIAQGDVEGGKKSIQDALKLNPAFDPAGAREARALLGQ